MSEVTAASNTNYSRKIMQLDGYRERPLPLWYYTVNPILPWDSEVVSCLVDMLMNVGK